MTIIQKARAFFKANRIISLCAATLLVSACASSSNNSNNTNSHSTRASGYTAQTQSNDVWQRVRNNYGIPDLYNAEVTKKEAYYAQRADYVARMTDRSGDFMYHIMNEIERRNMPSEIALLPFVESAFVTTAKSPVKASGLWQFMPATGKDFELKQNYYADQRNDVVASTEAALTFLQRLHDKFGDWQLALAAYNWGPGNVSKAVRRAQNAGLAGTYSDIKMPLETQQYIPKLQAIKNIVNNPAQFGITLPNIPNSPRHDIVNVTRDIDFATAARLAGMDVEAFRRINPAYKKSVIVASLGSKILVPADRADDLRRAFNSSDTLSSITTYSAYSSESLDDIANKFNTSASSLRALNNIPSFHDYVKSGSTLLVPRTDNNSSQDIPYAALTAGLSTSTGGMSLDGGTFTEQPAIILATSDEATRAERSGIIGASNTSFSNTETAINSQNNNADIDQIGFAIKNANNLSDPVTGKNAIVVGAATATPAPVFSQEFVVTPTPDPFQAAVTSPVAPVEQIALNMPLPTQTTVIEAIPVATTVTTPIEMVSPLVSQRLTANDPIDSPQSAIAPLEIDSPVQIAQTTPTAATQVAQAASNTASFPNDINMPPADVSTPPTANLADSILAPFVELPVIAAAPTPDVITVKAKPAAKHPAVTAAKNTSQSEKLVAKSNRTTKQVTQKSASRIELASAKKTSAPAPQVKTNTTTKATPKASAKVSAKADTKATPKTNAPASAALKQAQAQPKTAAKTTSAAKTDTKQASAKTTAQAAPKAAAKVSSKASATANPKATASTKAAAQTAPKTAAKTASTQAVKKESTKATAKTKAKS